MRVSSPIFLCSVLGCAWGKWHNEKATSNKCGRVTTGYRSYINGTYNVSLERVADILFGKQLFTSRFLSILNDTKFSRMANSIHKERITLWKRDSDDVWMSRRVFYVRDLFDVPFVETTNTAIYYTDEILLEKIVTNADFLLSGVCVMMSYCAKKIDAKNTSLEVSAKVVIDDDLLGLMLDKIYASSHSGFVELYETLKYILNWIPDHPDTPSELTILPIEKKEVAQSTHTRLYTKDGKTVIITPEQSKGVISFVYLLVVCLIITIVSSVACFVSSICIKRLQRKFNRKPCEVHGIEIPLNDLGGEIMPSY